MPDFFIGTSGWIYAHWKEAFYPKNLLQKGWLEFYATFFKTVEINATFYGWFKDKTFNNWHDRTPPEFRFVLKAPRLITHVKHLVNVEVDIERFWTSASQLNQKLSLILLQIAPDTPFEIMRLKKTLLAFPDPTKVAVEFRHPQWNCPEVIDLLSEMGVVYCNSDSPRTRLTNLVTSNIAYFRFHGRQQWYAYNYSNQELEEIAIMGKQLANHGVNNIFFFCNCSAI